MPSSHHHTIAFIHHDHSSHASHHHIDYAMRNASAQFDTRPVRHADVHYPIYVVHMLYIYRAPSIILPSVYSLLNNPSTPSIFYITTIPFMPPHLTIASHMRVGPFDFSMSSFSQSLSIRVTHLRSTQHPSTFQHDHATPLNNTPMKDGMILLLLLIKFPLSCIYF